MADFTGLNADKRERIINTALTVFGQNGYKKAAAAEIAQEADMQKGMLFHYFASKKDLYLYLIDYCVNVMGCEMDKRLDSFPDVFDKMKAATGIEMSLSGEYPAIARFLASLYRENDDDVKAEIERYIEDGIYLKTGWLLEGCDLSKFKDGVNPVTLEMFLIWAMEGFFDCVRFEDDTTVINGFVWEFYKNLDVMKKYLYK
jgi:AcrR family transcriptional regulator